MRGFFRVAMSVIMLSLAASSLGLAQWSPLSQALLEPDIYFVESHPKRPEILLAASKKVLFKSVDSGLNWKQVLSLKGDNAVQCLYMDSENPQTILVGCSKGIKRSVNGGQKWKNLSSAYLFRRENILCLASSRRHPGVIWAGTSNGLLMLSHDGSLLGRGRMLEGHKIYSILLAEKPDDSHLVLTDRGIFESGEELTSWKKVFAESWHNAQTDESAAQLQFGVEELPITMPASASLLKSRGIFYAASPSGILEGAEGGRNWSLLKGDDLPARALSMAASSQTFYVSHSHRIWRWLAETRRFQDISQGLEGAQVRNLSYNALADTLLAATDKGVFRLAFPETFLDISIQKPQAVPIDEKPSADVFLKPFESEPTIREIQTAAIHYAEVNPEKIEHWRRAAAKKALLPTVSVGGQMGVDESIDIDRGGTNDPDRFIYGPNERDYNWSVSMSWDLGDMIWNESQTSIDTRSKLMVELRDELLDEVTHLYFERRRLQVTTLMASQADTAARIEREIRLQELTAGIDALTGGYLSKRLQAAQIEH